MAPEKGEDHLAASTKRKRPTNRLSSVANQGDANGGEGERLGSSKRPKTSPVNAPLAPAGEDGDVSLVADADTSISSVDNAMDIESLADADTSISSVDNAMDVESPADADTSFPSADSAMDLDSPAAADTSISSVDRAMDVDSPADADTSLSSIDRTMDIGSPAGNATNKPGKHTKRVIDTSLRPISDVREMFEDMVERVRPDALIETPIKLSVATICSGTDAPIIALSLIQDAMQATGHGAGFEFDHLFSCEIEPAKQGFIRRNLPHPTVIFRDVMELANLKVDGQA